MKNKIVLISGGSSGLGLASTKAFLEREATVIVAARSREKFELNLDANHPGLHFIATDFSKMASVKQLYEQLSTKFKTIDIALNNVGGSVMKPLTDCDEDDFDQVMNVNLKSLWLGMKYQIRMMQQDSTADKFIVNVSSVNGLGGAEYISLYAAAKAGVISLTKSAALEHAKSNITINSIVPGPFATPLLDGALLAQAGGSKEQQKAIEEQYKQFIPKGRFGEPHEFAEAVLWLCQGSSKYISGHTLIMDGGMSSRFR
jgi:NAD(P)-dependent dehydrogenase (short-subunit alcohol dehydrogenase family)